MYAYKSKERFTYHRLKNSALSALYDHSRSRGIKKGWSHEMVLGSVSQNYEYGFSSPVEDIMWSCVMYVLYGGWFGKYGEYHKNKIENYIREYGIDDLLKDVPSEEAELFKGDLRVLGFIE